MPLFTDQQRRQLLANGRKPDKDYPPVAKLMMANFICLLSEMDADEDYVFGYFDHGFGCPELGYGSLNEMRDASKELCLPLVNDADFKATQSMSAYTAAGRRAGRIVSEL